MPECLLRALQDVGLYLFEEFGATIFEALSRRQEK